MYTSKISMAVVLYGFIILGVSFTVAQDIMFTSENYKALISADAAIGDRIQQVVALPLYTDLTIRYSIESNAYVGIDVTSGDVLLRELLPDNTDKLTLAVTATTTTSTARTVLELSHSTELCICFPGSDSVLNLTVLENVSFPHGLLYLNPRCIGSSDSGYSLSGSPILLLEGQRLVLNSNIDDLEGHTVLSCGNQELDIQVLKYAVPVVMKRIDGHFVKSFFEQYNVTMDPEQFDKIRHTNYKLALTSNVTDQRFKLIKLNDPGDNLKVQLEDRSLSTVAGRTLHLFVASWSNSLSIRQSLDIDVIIVDKNLDKRDLKVANMTVRFHVTYNDLNELETLQLNKSYTIEVNRTSAALQQVGRIEHTMATSLLFELNSLPMIRSCPGAFAMTKHQGIVYVADENTLRSCSRPMLFYQLTVTQAGISRNSMMKIILNGNVGSAGSSNTSQESIRSCSAHTNMESCESSSGVGTNQCVWKEVIDGVSNYSTCVPADTCANQECDEVESMEPTLCPQDCHSKWLGEHKRICGEDVIGICQARGICYCHSMAKYCQCLNPTSINQTDDDFDEDVLKTNFTARDGVVYRGMDDSMCDMNCIVIVSISGAVLILVLVVLSLWCYHKFSMDARKGSGINAWRVNGNNLHLTLTPCPDYGESTPSTVISTASDWPEFHPYNNIGSMELFDEKWELPRYNIVLEGFIGEGEFGRVMKARHRTDVDAPWSPVAVKMLKDGASRTEFCDLLSEYNLLKEVDHPNVIKLIGAATMNGPFHLVVEYCEHGSLKNYLRKIRTSEPIYMNGFTQYYSKYATELLGYAWQISKGMQYLSEIKLVHRDLATRNILIAADNVIKISDFGMTKDIYEEDAYKKKGQGRIPVKWMAPESLYHQIYTCKSDVWSYGIVLWEMATLGATPYPGIPPERMYQLLQDGYRMDRPETCSPALYSLMRHCWEYDPISRPPFKDIKDRLEVMLEDKAEYLDLSVAHSHRLRSEEVPSTSGSEDDPSDTSHLTVALLPHDDSKCVDQYLISSNDRQAAAAKHRYTVLEFEEE